MAVSFRTVGTWAELTADGTVAIPATPQAGDRMYLFARWKDFSITATVANWTAALTPFADGAISAGNGTGSVKVGCWYRDWQSGDTDPTIDFSASPDNASVVIMVMAKDAADTWLTPVAVTAAMTNWTTTSQIVSASSTANVLGGGVVMGLIGLRDDSAVMTRPTSGIDDSTGAITWNGDYVESPATHHSTTTGFDGAADLGYRLVTAGATVTLRMTGTISAAETGAALWVVQGVEANLIIDNSGHLQGAANLALTQTHVITVQGSSHAQTAANAVLTQVHEAVVQGSIHDHAAESLTLTQLHVLDVLAATHAHSSNSPTLEVIHHLETQDAVHDHAAASPALEVVHNLELEEAVHNHSAESLLLEQIHELVVDNALHSHTAQSPNVRTFSIIFLDPGGDAVQMAGYPNSITGDVTFDPTEKVVGVGSWKHDSTGSNAIAASTVAGVLGLARRVSLYFQYDSVPDTSALAVNFSTNDIVYSGGGFINADGLFDDDDNLATATPAKNFGQGNVLTPYGFGEEFSLAAIIDSVKIIYERRYDVDTSIGISRVKWRVNGEEGPNHDNTDMPLTDTVVEVDVTNDRFWEPQDLSNDAFEVIAEARRGDTDTEHIQSWDYVKVEVSYHTAVPIIDLVSGGVVVTQIALLPKGSGVVTRLVAADGDFFDGITELAPAVFHHLSFAYVLAAADDLSFNLFVEDIPELSLSELPTGGAPGLADLRYGWTTAPGANHVCWFDQIAIDEGDDLTDIGNVLSTAKRGATVNNDNFDTTGGTGAVDERPVNLDNYRAQVATAQVEQDYTLEAADEGDVDISGETLRGYMGWLIAKKVGPIGGSFGFILNGNITTFTLPTSPGFVKLPVTSTSYPSDAAGIGLRSATTSHDAYLYEGGVVVAYEGPLNPDILLPRQEVANETLGTIVDDLRADPPESYELCWLCSESESAMAALTISTIHSEGGEPRQYRPFSITSSGGRRRIDPGIEVRVDLTVTGGNVSVAIWRRLNVD